MQALNAMAYIALLILLTPVQLGLSILRGLLMLGGVFILLVQAALMQFTNWLMPANWKKEEARDAR